MDVQKSNIYLGVMNASAVGMAPGISNGWSAESLSCPWSCLLLILVVWIPDGTVRPENTKLQQTESFENCFQRQTEIIDIYKQCSDGLLS